MTDYPHQQGSPEYDGSEAFEAHLKSELTNYKLGFATQTEERERLEVENERLREVISEYLAYCVPLDQTTGEPILIGIRKRMQAALLPKDGTP